MAGTALGPEAVKYLENAVLHLRNKRSNILNQIAADEEEIKRIDQDYAKIQPKIDKLTTDLEAKMKEREQLQGLLKMWNTEATSTIANATKLIRQSKVATGVLARQEASAKTDMTKVATKSRLKYNPDLAAKLLSETSISGGGAGPSGSASGSRSASASAGNAAH
eukprot:tig00021441_g21553.t1